MTISRSFLQGCVLPPCSQGHPLPQGALQRTAAADQAPKGVQVAPRRKNQGQAAEAGPSDSAVRTIVAVPNVVAGAIHPLPPNHD